MKLQQSLWSNWVMISEMFFICFECYLGPLCCRESRSLCNSATHTKATYMDKQHHTEEEK